MDFERAHEAVRRDVEIGLTGFVFTTEEEGDGFHFQEAFDRWQDGGVTPISRVIDLFAAEPSNAVEWYYPKRLNIDTNGADQMKMNGVAKFLGLRLMHTNDINVPIYAFPRDKKAPVSAGALALKDLQGTWVL